MMQVSQALGLKHWTQVFWACFFLIYVENNAVSFCRLRKFVKFAGANQALPVAWQPSRTVAVANKRRQDNFNHRCFNYISFKMAPGHEPLKSLADLTLKLITLWEKETIHRSTVRIGCPGCLMSLRSGYPNS